MAVSLDPDDERVTRLGISRANALVSLGTRLAVVPCMRATTSIDFEHHIWVVFKNVFFGVLGYFLRLFSFHVDQRKDRFLPTVVMLYSYFMMIKTSVRSGTDLITEFKVRCGQPSRT